MPVYEYRCENCGEQVEVLVRSRTSTPPTCPNCGSSLLEKLLSVPYVMKGERHPAGLTCCGRGERCEAPPCSTDEVCRRR
ncbi:MAG: zinc ribbon domain-containing protein [Anaerolineae bacterium]|nr:zinc ribbon domain-containing protein [Anaerolineae bacterium]